MLFTLLIIVGFFLICLANCSNTFDLASNKML